MTTYRDYKELSQNIHAPEELKDCVLFAAQSRRMASRRSIRFIPKAVAAAILAIVLPVTAYAAAKGFGLLEHLAEAGMENTQSIQVLHAEIAPRETYRNNFAEYTVMEAVCDNNSLCVAAQITPLDESHLLVPQFITEDASVQELQIDGVTEGTVGEYAASLGKSLVYADIGYWNGESHLDGSASFRCDTDGTLYYFYSAVNTFSSNQIDLTCAGVAYTEEMSIADRVEFQTKLFDKSSSVERAYTNMDPKTVSETGIQVQNVTILETELGLYATFTFTVQDFESWRDCLSFKMLNSAGEELTLLPGIGSGIVENGDGSYCVTLSCQKPLNAEGLQFMIRNYVTDTVYGPYAIA